MILHSNTNLDLHLLVIFLCIYYRLHTVNCRFLAYIKLLSKHQKYLSRLFLEISTFNLTCGGSLKPDANIFKVSLFPILRFNP